MKTGRPFGFLACLSDNSEKPSTVLFARLLRGVLNNEWKSGNYFLATYFPACVWEVFCVLRRAQQREAVLVSVLGQVLGSRH